MSKKFLSRALCPMLVALCFSVEAQQTGKVHRIGVLISATPSAAARRVQVLQQGLRELGYVEGKNISIEYRYADGKLESLAELAAELVRLKVDIIVTDTSNATDAAKSAGVHALTFTPSTFLVTNRQKFIDLTAKVRLPAIYPSMPHAEAGGLMSYSPDILDNENVGTWVYEQFRKAAIMCIHTRNRSIPATDRVIAELLYIKGDEKAYLKIANATPVL